MNSSLTPSVFAVTCTITQRAGMGLHMATSTHWDPHHDGDFIVRPFVCALYSSMLCDLHVTGMFVSLYIIACSRIFSCFVNYGPRFRFCNLPMGRPVHVCNSCRIQCSIVSSTLRATVSPRRKWTILVVLGSMWKVCFHWKLGGYAGKGFVKLYILTRHI